ncbi:MAG: NfeD family protein [Methanoregula sp.]|jgi:membrane-bound ClpP family serine protease
MVLLEGITLGWLLIIIGALLLLVEVQSPGFFAAVPATIMIIFGILLLLGMDILTYPWGIILAVIVAIIASYITVMIYSRITPDLVPTTISRDTLVGMEGVVQVTVNPTTIAGKVVLASAEWSARSTGNTIPAGKKVRVVSSQGVHIVVEEVV